MAERIAPKDEESLCRAIAAAVADTRRLAVEGRGSKRGLGRPVDADAVLSLAGLSGITYYEPGELVIEAGAATPLAEIEAALAENGQHLAFEPTDLGPFYGVAAAAGSIGGTVACNLSGSRRPYAGAARDHVLGIRAVSGRGELFVSGGRVVKNVTGYDMSKLLSGSYGTLAALSQVTVKVLPRAETIRTVLVYGQDAGAAHATLAEAAAGPADISGAAYLPAAAAARSAVDYVSGFGGPVTALRIEGSRDGAAARTAALRGALAGSGAGEELHTIRSRALWAEIGSGALLPPPGEAVETVWRLSLPPADGFAAVQAVQHAHGGEALFDWGGGLAWLALGPEALGDDPAAGAARLRAAVAAQGGYATLVRAAEALRKAVPVFHPEAAPAAALSRRVKDNFDPEGILNPGRMVEEL